MQRPFSTFLRAAQPPVRRCWLAWLLSGAALLLLVGCADAGYYLQSIGGHLKLLAAARPLSDWAADPATSPRLHDRLELARRVRAYAADELKLPDNPSYRRYAQIERRAVVWNVVAAAPDSLALKTWCFPVAGCVGYRGYYEQADAEALAGRLEAEGLEVAVQPVPAYSTLGWSNWLGGDPLLSTFIFYPEGELARLIFHELAHQKIYVKDDTMFNESFATAVERLGAARWLAARGSDTARSEYARFDARRRAFRDLVLATRRDLEQVYASRRAAALSDPSFLAMKKRAMDEFRANWQRLRTRWLTEPGTEARELAGYDFWVAHANNARFGAMAAYDGLVPGFVELFEREGGDWTRFYDAVRRLAALPKAERDRRLGAVQWREERAREREPAAAAQTSSERRGGPANRTLGLRCPHPFGLRSEGTESCDNGPEVCETNPASTARAPNTRCATERGLERDAAGTAARSRPQPPVNSGRRA